MLGEIARDAEAGDPGGAGGLPGGRVRPGTTSGCSCGRRGRQKPIPPERRQGIRRPSPSR